MGVFWLDMAIVPLISIFKKGNSLLYKKWDLMMVEEVFVEWRYFQCGK